MNNNRYIIVQTNGFVRVGEVEKINHHIFGEVYKISDNSIIRNWGTQHGLGQLATQGKQKGTILDFEGITYIPTNKVVHFIEISKDVDL